MPKWQFWKKSPTEEKVEERPPVPVAASRAKGFVAPPPRPASGITGRSEIPDPRLSRLVHRQEMIQQEIDQAELAGIPGNPWAERAALIDEAIAGIDAELRRPIERVDVPVPALPSTPIAIDVIQAEAPSHVRLTVEGQPLDYAEEIDWAERGTTIVRGDMERSSGNLPALATALGLDDDTATKLELSLFELATAARDRSLEDAGALAKALVSDLLRPCPECGDLALWNGVCLRCEERNAARFHLEEERKRLFDERDSMLKEREALIERLPGLRKRLAETKAAIEKVETEAPG
jgi:hypothetical protein